VLGPATVDADTLLAGLPPIWPDANLREEIGRWLAERDRVVVALDDDPTGTQTVHEVSVLTSWAEDELSDALRSGDPAVFILTNTRSMPLESAQAVNRQVARSLFAASRRAGKSLTIVSRSDSTLRGHYPGEIEALAEALVSDGARPFDATCLVPFFPEGGRLTVNDVHWVREGRRLVPAAETPYARDSVFGYTESYLPRWVEEKTDGRVRASEVSTISLDDLRLGGPDVVARKLLRARPGGVVCVNAADYRDLEVFVRGSQLAEVHGRHFLFRTAASFVKVAAGISDRDLLTAAEIAGGRPSSGGLVVVGSHVPRSTAQLECLMERLPAINALELDVSRLLSVGERFSLVRRTAAALDGLIHSGRDAVIFTSRALVRGATKTRDLEIAAQVSSALVDLVSGLQSEPRYVIGKGGITASDLATGALRVRSARVLGQILPGVPVWRLGRTSRWPGMPYVVFPGNVGAEDALATIVARLSTRAQPGMRERTGDEV
jgi:uncharacterized protein YgbK (DUF1537 family)